MGSGFGGGLFSISESPIESTRLDDDRVLLTPMSWKHMAAPPPLVLRLDVEHGRVRRLVAEEYAESAMSDPWKVAADRLATAAAGHQGLSTNALIKAAGVSKGTGIAVLEQLSRQGRLRVEDRVGWGGGKVWHAST